MQWLGTSRPSLWVCFLPKLNFLPLLNVPPQVSILVKETPAWGHYFVFLSYPSVTVKTKIYFYILNHVLNHTGSIVKTIFASIAREVFVCLSLMVIIMNKSNMNSLPFYTHLSATIYRPWDVCLHKHFLCISVPQDVLCRSPLNEQIYTPT